VSPILGIWASQNYSRYSITGSYESIATVTVGSGGAANVEFTSIPSTYTHLQIRAFSKTNRSDATTDILKLNVNADTGTNYSWHTLGGNGSTAFVDKASTTSYIRLDWTAGSGTGSSNVFGVSIIDILDYANTNKYKTFKTLMGVDLNSGDTSSRIYFESGLWQSTSAITSIKFTQLDGTQFTQYSHFALYGIKSA
jgi:hypothetical protein